MSNNKNIEAVAHGSAQADIKAQDSLFVRLAKEAEQYNVDSAQGYEALKRRWTAQGLLAPNLEIVHTRTDSNNDGYLSLEEINDAQRDPKVSRGVKVFLTMLEREYTTIRNSHENSLIEGVIAGGAIARGIPNPGSYEKTGISQADIAAWSKTQKDLQQREKDAQILSALSHDTFLKLAKINQPKNGDTAAVDREEIIKVQDLMQANLSGLSAREQEAIKVLRKYYGDIKRSFDHGLRDDDGVFKADVLAFIKNRGRAPADPGLLGAAQRFSGGVAQGIDDGRQKIVDGIAKIPDPELPDPRKLFRR